MGRISIKKRHSLRKDEIALLFSDLSRELGDEAALFSGERVEKVETDADLTIFLIDRQPLLMRMGGWVFPTLRGAIARPFTGRRIVVDRGAIPFIAKGADVMRPGIVSISDDVRRGAPVLVQEETHAKPLAVALALADAAEIRAQEKGKVCRTVHHVGDPVWALEL